MDFINLHPPSCGARCLVNNPFDARVHPIVVDDSPRAEEQSCARFFQLCIRTSSLGAFVMATEKDAEAAPKIYAASLRGAVSALRRRVPLRLVAERRNRTAAEISSR